MTDITKIVITATDQASEVFTKVQGSAERLQGVYAKLAAAFTGAVGIGYFVHLIKGAIDAAEAIDKLSQKTGISVQQLSQLEYIMKLQGVTTESFGKGMKTLAERMVETTDATSKSHQLMKMLGVDVAAGPNKAIDQLAGVFSKLNDGATKTTLAVYLFGKTGMDMIPVLNQGREGMAKLRQEAELLGITYGEDFAQAASKFNDNLKTIKASSEALGIALANSMLPALIRITAAMKEAAKDKGVLAALAVGFGGAIYELTGGEEAAQARHLADLKQKIAEYEQVIADAAKRGYDTQYALTIEGQKRLEQLREELRLIQAADVIRRYGTDDQVSRRMRQGQVLSPSGGPDEAALAKLLGDKGGAGKGDAALSLMVKLQQEAAKLNEELTGQLQNQTLINTQLELQRGKYGSVGFIMQSILLMQSAYVDALKAQVEHVKFLNEEHQKELDYAEQHGKLLEEMSNSWADRTKDLQDELKYLGLSNTERQKAVLLEKAREDIFAAGNDAATIRDINANLETQLGLLDQINESQQRISGWYQLADAIGRVASRVSTVRDELKRMLQEMIQIFMRRWILSLGASMTGGATSSALASQASSAGQGTLSGAANGLIGTGLTAANEFGGGLIGASTFTGGVSASVFGTGSLTAAGDFVGTGLAGLAGNAALAAGATDAFASAVAAAVPVIGWIVAIAAILYAVFGNKGGGPKAGGSFLGAFSGTGAFMGDLTSTVDRSHYLHDETNQDSAAQKMGIQLAKTYAQTLAGLGGSAAGVQLGVGFSRDFAGDAPSMVGGLVRDANGNVVYAHDNRDVGRSDQDLTNALQIEGQRVILAALKASDLPSAIKGYLAQFDVAGISDSEVANVVRGAQAVKGLIDESSNLDAVVADLADGGLRTFGAQLEALGTQLKNAQMIFAAALESKDPQQILAAEQQLRQTIVARYQQEIQLAQELAQQIDQLKDAAYNFAFAIGQKIIAAGGSSDISGMSWNRAMGLRGTIGGGDNPAQQLSHLGQFSGALDNWYASERARIERDMAAQAESARAIAQAQQSAAQARISQLQQELQIAQQWKGVLDQAGAAIDQMQLSTANPLSASGRLQLSSGEVNELFQAFLAASGTDKIALAQQLMPALQTQLNLFQGNYDRPSDEYAGGYNSIIAKLTAVQDAARTEAARAGQIQEDILATQQQAAMYAAMAAGAAQQSSSALDELNAQYVTQLEWEQAQGERLYNLQITTAQAALDAVTGGVDVDLFIAQKNAQMLDELVGLRGDVRAFLAALSGTPAPTGTPTPTGSTQTPNPLGRRSGGITINLNGGPNDDVVDTIIANASRIRRALADS